MTMLLASVMATTLNCAGTQSSALLWQEEPTRFQLELKAHDFSGSDGLFVWELTDREITVSKDGGQLLTATLKGFPNAAFSALLAPNDDHTALSWRITEAAAKDGRRTLTSEGKATCKADNQVKTQ